MSFEKEYYDFDRFWRNYDYSYSINIEKIKITFDYIGPDVTSLLDAACGNGIFTNMALERFPDMKIVAFDRSETALQYVKAQKFVGSIDAIPFPDSHFDCVIAHDVIEHLPEPVYYQAMKELSRVARKYIIIAVPFEENLEDNISQCPSCKTIFNNDLHMRNFDKGKMRQLFHEAGFACNQIRTCEKNTFYMGQKLYGNLFYQKWKKHFRSPICPLCGFKNPADEDPEYAMTVEHQPPPKSLLSYIKALPKAVWPKYTKDYEMVALFKKTEQ